MCLTIGDSNGATHPQARTWNRDSDNSFLSLLQIFSQCQKSVPYLLLFTIRLHSWDIPIIDKCSVLQVLFSWLGSLTSEPQSFPISCLPYSRIISNCTVPSFLWGSGDWSQVLMLVPQAFYRLTYLSSPKTWSFWSVDQLKVCCSDFKCLKIFLLSLRISSLSSLSLCS